ncbi:hypothetical protein HF521_017911 [Silurus meridionalis]|uniref:Uncharacterized protein n=1 Tax=Silurus meridionalis TaxID=175797 RepID=A0A8T0BPA9_SILME|nr:hypothetical protein HF521_017911 [Silurus meridionalis]
MHAGLLSLWVTGALLLHQCFSDPDDSEYEYVTGDDINYIDYIDYNETDYENTTFVDYNLYATPKKGIRSNQEQSISEKDGAVNYGTNQINDKASSVFRYCALGLGLILQQFCQ